MPDSKPVIIIGAGDHAKVLLDILLEQNVNVIGLKNWEYERMLFIIFCIESSCGL